ncbi:hypothetical protein JTB14_031884 [Gonioctena quinquepunctata]|nr:hypothetical protein JTB14_031884 [Gonioctena quinquepunctata]
MTETEQSLSVPQITGNPEERTVTPNPTIGIAENDDIAVRKCNVKARIHTPNAIWDYDFACAGMSMECIQQPPLTPSPQFFVRWRYCGKLEWANINSNNISEIVRTKFPDVQEEFHVTDVAGAKINPDFLPTFLGFSEGGI